MWFAVALAALALVASVAAILLIPEPRMENARSVGLDDFQIPTNSNGRVIPIVFGTCKVSGNILWYGDLRSNPIYVG